MWVIVLTLALVPGKQQIYTNYGPEPVRFNSRAECAERAKVEMERVKRLVRGEFTLYCVPESVLERGK